MATITARCDVCEAVLSGAEISRYYDGRDLCHRCKLIEEMADLKRALADKKQWFEAAWGQWMRVTEAKIAAKVAELASLK